MKIPKKLTWITASILIIIIIVLLALPGFVKRYAIKHSKDLIGRQIHVEKLKLNYFTGKIKVIDFEMYEANEKDVFISFDTLIVNLKPYQFFIDEFILERMYLQGLNVNIIQTDSIFNFDDLLLFHAKPEDTVQSTSTDEQPFQYHFSNLELKNAEFNFDDRNVNKATRLKDISFFIPYIGWNQEDKSEAGLRFSFEEEGYFESTLFVDPNRGEYEAHITVDHLSLDSFNEYVAENAKISKLNGLFNSEITITGNINMVENSLVSGSIEISDFLMEDLQNKPFLGVKKLNCKIREINLQNNAFIVDSLLISEPYVYFELDSNSNNLIEIFDLNSNAEDSADVEQSVSIENDTLEGKPLIYAINNMHIEEGVIDYTDNLTGTPFKYNLSELSLNTDSIKSTSEWIELYTQMLLNKRGKLVAEVGLNPGNPMDIELNYVITDFQLSDLNIYSRHYMGFPIIYGQMYYKSTTHIRDGQLQSENRLVIEHAELGNKSGGLHDLPLKFALFLLKDRDGVIDLDVPVRGDLKDPEVDIGKIVWNTFKNLIVKVAAAPFDFLAGLVSVDPKDIQAIDYAYGDTTLSDKIGKQLDILLELEQKKEGLDIELIYFNDIEKEKDQVAIDSVGRLYKLKSGKEYKLDDPEFEEFLSRESGSDSIDIAKSARMMVTEQVLDSIVHVYALTRKQNLEQYLTSKNDSTQIRFILSNPESPKNVGATPTFEVKYSMKDSEIQNR
ncbi:MAG: DUF748 domain-containing protein [Cyclobacteriaceae bacterium]|jgi:hypothetical protein